jgi:hypothetical protein
MQELYPALKKRWQRYEHFLATGKLPVRMTDSVGSTGMANIDSNSGFPGAIPVWVQW